jgi:catechol 2,3-dioxygenase-like lactoylglutathione lyase family enzyme
MIGYATIGTNDLDRARAFYDAVAATLGGRRIPSPERMQMYGGSNGTAIAVCQPYDGGPAGVGNGSMFALAAQSHEAVDAAHAAALAAGGTCEGPPGDRGGGFYGAYFRDLDGNKLCAYKMG